MLKVTLIAMGNKMPSWVIEATLEYTKRLKEYVKINSIEIPLQKRSKGCNLSQILEKESSLLLSHIPSNAYVIAMDLEGKLLKSEALATYIDKLQLKHSHWCFMIGGPEGFTPEVLMRANEKWALSPLTLTHPLARITLLETLYRSFCILSNHPFHK